MFWPVGSANSIAEIEIAAGRSATLVCCHVQGKPHNQVHPLAADTSDTCEPLPCHNTAQKAFAKQTSVVTLYKAVTVTLRARLQYIWTRSSNGHNSLLRDLFFFFLPPWLNHVQLRVVW